MKQILLADSGNTITIDNISETINNDMPSIKPASCSLDQAGLSQDTLYT
jgi:hypothetical protein